MAAHLFLVFLGVTFGDSAVPTCAFFFGVTVAGFEPSLSSPSFSALASLRSWRGQRGNPWHILFNMPRKYVLDIMGCNLEHCFLVLVAIHIFSHFFKVQLNTYLAEHPGLQHVRAIAQIMYACASMRMCILHTGPSLAWYPHPSAFSSSL